MSAGRVARLGRAVLLGGFRHARGSGSSGSALALLAVPGKLAALIGEADAAVVLSGQLAGGGAPLASLGPVAGLAQVARGEIGRATFARLHGHRGAHEIEVSAPRPAEDAAWIDDQLACLRDATHGPGDLLARQEAARQAAWERLAQQRPKKAARACAVTRRWAEATRPPEAARSELAKSSKLQRQWVLHAGELTGHGGGLFFFSWRRILDVQCSGGNCITAI